MKVSIITATYNNEETVEETILSVFDQSYKDIEHIIIDGCSCDKTIHFLNKHQDKISKIISEPDRGIYDALNKGIKNSTGDLIAFLHADDIYTDNKIIEEAVDLIKKEKTDSVYADLLYVSKNNTNKVIRNWKAGKFKYSKLKKGWMPPHPTFLVKKEIYNKFGSFDSNFRIAADYDIILRFLGKHRISSSYLPKVMIKMRIGGESNKSLKNIIDKMKEDLKAIKKNKAGNWKTLFFKNIIKIPQLFVK